MNEKQILLPKELTSYQQTILEKIKELYPNCKSIELEDPHLENKELDYTPTRRVFHVHDEEKGYMRLQMIPPYYQKNYSQDNYVLDITYRNKNYKVVAVPLKFRKHKHV